MNCPACTHPIEPNTFFTCRRCWGLIPGKERRALARMHNRGQPIESKLAKCVKLVKEKLPTS